MRCWYIKLRETVPPNDPKLRKKFYEDKVSIKSKTDLGLLGVTGTLLHDYGDKIIHF